MAEGFDTTREEDMRSITKLSAMAALVAACGIASVSQAALTFSFADPVPGRQLSYSHGTGIISYDNLAAITVLVDGSTEPIAFNAAFPNSTMTMSLAVGTVSVAGPVIQAPVAGFFELRDASSALILRGDTANGAFIRLGSTSSILMSDDISFAYTAGPSLTALLLPGRALANPQEAVFTVTDLLVGGGGPLVVDGQMRSWTANASYSGNSDVVPAPGAIALASLGGLLIARRKRA
jgi:hypothetical protein